MGKTPVRFRDSATDPSQDEIPLRAVSCRPLITCGVILLVVGLVACGGLMFVSAQMGSKPTPTAEPPSATPTPDDWAATGTAIAGWTPTYTPTPTETPSSTPTPTATLDDWDMTGTAVFWLTYTPTPTETPSPTMTRTPHSGPNILGQWWMNVQGTVQANRTQQMLMATVTAQAITPQQTPTPMVQIVEVTRVVQGSAPPPGIEYVEVTRVVNGGGSGGGNPAPLPTFNVQPLPTVNPTFYVWLTWTATPTVPGITPTASPTYHISHTPYAISDTPTSTATATATATPEPTSTPVPSLTPSVTATETPTATATDEMTSEP